MESVSEVKTVGSLIEELQEFHPETIVVRPASDGEEWDVIPVREVLPGEADFAGEGDEPEIRPMVLIK